MTRPRAHDLVLFGASGFTGALTAEYLARHLPGDARWALAGRDRAKLEAVRAGLGERWAELPLLHADVSERASLDAVAESSRVVVTTVGPYLDFGEPLVAACAEAGTDYLDLTGEPEFFDRSYLRYHATAQRTGARLVHACGFDSIPHDMGVFYTVKQLPAGVPLKITGMVSGSSSVSGGTYSSALTAFSRLFPMYRTARERARATPKPDGRRVRARTGFTPHRDHATGRWLVPFPTLDPLVIRRSAQLLDSYGPDFSYEHFGSLENLPTVVAASAVAGALIVGAQVPPLRRALGNLRKPGDGPDPERRARSWFKVRFVGEGGGKRVVTEVAGGDPGYGETAKMLGESAMCLAYDELPPVAGQVTTAAAMGDALVARLVDAGMVFRIATPKAE